MRRFFPEFFFSGEEHGGSKCIVIPPARACEGRAPCLQAGGQAALGLFEDVGGGKEGKRPPRTFLSSGCLLLLPHAYRVRGEGLTRKGCSALDLTLW